MLAVTSLGQIVSLGQEAGAMPYWDAMSASAGRALVDKFVGAGVVRPENATSLKIFFTALPMARQDWQRKELAAAWPKYQAKLAAAKKAGVTLPEEKGFSLLWVLGGVLGVVGLGAFMMFRGGSRARY